MVSMADELLPSSHGQDRGELRSVGEAVLPGCSLLASCDGVWVNSMLVSLGQLSPAGWRVWRWPGRCHHANPLCSQGSIYPVPLDRAVSTMSSSGIAFPKTSPNWGASHVSAMGIPADAHPLLFSTETG